MRYVSLVEGRPGFEPGTHSGSCRLNFFEFVPGQGYNHGVRSSWQGFPVP